jgi:hypothetical protein
MGNGIYRKAVEQSLRKYGSRIYGTMYDHMIDSHLPVSTRRYIPWLFSQTVSEDSWEILKMSLKFCSIPIRHGIVKALLRMRKRDPSLRVSDDIIGQNIEREIERYSKLKKALSFYQSGKVTLSDEADEILGYEIEQTFENIFRLLSLNNDIEDIDNAYKAIVGDNPRLRSDAIEFVENLINWEVRKLLIPILETYQTDRLPPNSFSSSLSDTEDVLFFLKGICHAELEEKLAPNLEDQQESERQRQVVQKENVEVKE